MLPLNWMHNISYMNIDVKIKVFFSIEDIFSAFLLYILLIPPLVYGYLWLTIF